MAEYEVVREIQNECERNQMRDVFFDEIETDDPVEYVRGLLKNDQLTDLNVERDAAGNITVYANCAGIIQKFVFSLI